MRDELVRDATRDAPVPYFFLSYAHTQRNGSGNPPDLDAWVFKLFRDLCNHINSLTSMPKGHTAGFMDRELLPGHDWPAHLGHALATCRVFVPLYSRRYFESEHCGKEWSAFARRVRDSGAGTPSAIIPAVWVPVERRHVPAAARSVPYDYAGLESYEAYGFYGIVKLSRYRDDYEHAVRALAGRIVGAAESSQLRHGRLVDYNGLENAFGRAAREMPGGQTVRITIVAPRHGELPDGRGPYHYGTAARDWHPYRPESGRALADYVTDVVRRLGYRPVVGDLYEHGEDLLSPGRPSAPEVVIVDAWAARQEKFRQPLRRLDALDKPWVQVLIPWNRRDRESAAAENELRVALDSVLRRKLAEGRATSSLAVRGVPTLEDLGRVLQTVIVKSIRQYLRYAPAYPPAGEVVERPRLSVAMTEFSDREFPGD